MRTGKWNNDAQTRAFMRIDLTDMLRDYKSRSFNYPCPCGQGTFVVKDQDARTFSEKDNLLFCYGCRRSVFLDVPKEFQPPRALVRKDRRSYGRYYGYYWCWSFYVMLKLVCLITLSFPSYDLYHVWYKFPSWDIHIYIYMFNKVKSFPICKFPKSRSVIEDLH